MVGSAARERAAGGGTLRRDRAQLWGSKPQHGPFLAEHRPSALRLREGRAAESSAAVLLLQTGKGTSWGGSPRGNVVLASPRVQVRVHGTVVEATAPGAVAQPLSHHKEELGARNSVPVSGTSSCCNAQDSTFPAGFEGVTKPELVQFLTRSRSTKPTNPRRGENGPFGASRQHRGTGFSVG